MLTKRRSVGDRINEIVKTMALLELAERGQTLKHCGEPMPKDIRPVGALERQMEWMERRMEENEMVKREAMRVGRGEESSAKGAGQTRSSFFRKHMREDVQGGVLGRFL